jgi:uncharacterized phage-associated protein
MSRFHVLLKRRGAMIAFRYSESKTTQVAAIFIKKHGNTLNYTKLIKLLYLTDREALFRWERPLTGDSYVSMPKGPVLSRTYDLIDYPDLSGNRSYWHRFIRKASYDVSLIDEPGTDELSQRELNLIEQIYEQFKDKDWREMIVFCHKYLPEWKDPGDTSTPLPIEDMLRVSKKTEKEIELIDEEASNLKYFDLILPAA